MKKLSKFAVTLLTLISFSFSGVAEDENKIIHTTKFSPALVEYAANGNHIAQNTLGIVYLKGLGTDVDVSKAVYWFNLSAEGGNSSGMCNLGACYLKGNGVAQDFARAAELFEKAAMLDNQAAIFNLATMYSKGQGGPKIPSRLSTLP